jgi:hypothetical protein
MRGHRPGRVRRHFMGDRLRLLGLILEVEPRTLSSSARAPRMSGPRSKLFISLFAIALNVVGTPMAWARMASMIDTGANPGSASMQHCAGDAGSDDSDETSTESDDNPDCCEGGACSCGFVPSAVVFALPASPDAAGPTSVESGSTLPVPADPIDDSLRPPIT